MTQTLLPSSELILAQDEVLVGKDDPVVLSTNAPKEVCPKTSHGQSLPHHPIIV